jgi:hypothetical protein
MSPILGDLRRARVAKRFDSVIPGVFFSNIEYFLYLNIIDPVNNSLEMLPKELKNF